MKVFVKIFLLIFVTIIMLSCNVQKVNIDESIIIIERKKNDQAILLGMDVILDNQKIASLKVGETFRYVIKNGDHVLRTAGAGSLSDSETLAFTVNSKKITFLIGYEGWTLGITKTKEEDLK